MSGIDAQRFRRIATEEAWAPSDMIRRYRGLISENKVDDPGFRSLMGYFLFNESPVTKGVVERLQDAGERRIADMDATGIAKQIIGITSPGVQIFDADTATRLSVEYNDELAEACRRYPDRLYPLAAIAPQDPKHAAAELERAVTRLGMKGAIVNSHTHGEYLDDERFWDIFAAAEALDVPVYIHPQTPPKSMIAPFLDRGLDSAVYGFGVETGLHMLRLIVSGVFDRFPKLSVVVGHLGEGIPFWLYRVDFFHARIVKTKRYEKVKPLELTPSEYMRRNFHVTTSGMAWEPAILYVRQVLGAERVMYAMDYPYQFVPEEVEAMDALSIPDDEKIAFYETNAKRVFRLD